MFEGMYSVEVNERGNPVLKIDYDAIESILDLEYSFPKGYASVRTITSDSQVWGVKVEALTDAQRFIPMLRDKLISLMISATAKDECPELDWSFSVVEPC